MRYGLNQEIINDLKNVFSQYPEIEKVMIYGSRSQGNYKNGSDIDLTFFGKNLTQHQLFSIDNQIEALNLPYYLDLSIFEQIDNPQLKNQILQSGQIFYQKIKCK